MNIFMMKRRTKLNNPRVITKRILEIVQILYQNKAITDMEKQTILRELNNSYKTNSLKEVHETLLDLKRKVVLFDEFINEAIELTS